MWKGNAPYHGGMLTTGKLTRWQRLIGHLNEFLFGAAMSWVMPPYQLRRRAELERVFILLTTCELMGAPVLPHASALRLLPFAVPQILYWRRRMKLWDEGLEVADLKHLGH